MIKEQGIIGWYRRFHEAPLVVFTSAAICGAGAALAGPLAQATGILPFRPQSWTAALVLGLIGGGLLVSMRHLGRGERAFRAFRRPWRSPLSAEVAFALLICGAVLALLIFPMNESGAGILWILAAAAACGLLISLVRVYSLRAQLTWNGISRLSPFTPSLLFGIAAHVSAGEPLTSGTVWSVRVLVVLDSVMWIARCLEVEKGRKIGTAAQPQVMAARHWIMSLRFAIIDLIFPASLQIWGGAAGLAALAIGILVDRFAFYGFAIKHATEAQVARVEAILRQLGTSPISSEPQ